MFTQSVLYILLLYIEDYRCLKKVIHQNDQTNSANERLVGFCLNTGKHFFLEVSF